MLRSSLTFKTTVYLLYNRH